MLINNFTYSKRNHSDSLDPANFTEKQKLKSGYFKES